MTPSYSELPSLAAYYSKMLYIYFFSLYSDLSFSLPFLSFSFFMISHSLYLFSLFLSLRLPLSHIKFRVDFGNRCDWIMVVRRTLCLTSVLSFAPCLYSTSHHRLAHQEIFFFFFLLQINTGVETSM